MLHPHGWSQVSEWLAGFGSKEETPEQAAHRENMEYVLRKNAVEAAKKEAKAAARNKATAALQAPEEVRATTTCAGEENAPAPARNCLKPSRNRRETARKDALKTCISVSIVGSGWQIA